MEEGKPEENGVKPEVPSAPAEVAALEVPAEETEKPGSMRYIKDLIRKQELAKLNRIKREQAARLRKIRSEGRNPGYEREPDKPWLMAKERKEREQLPDEKWVEIKRMYIRDGIKPSEIAEKTGVKIQTINQRMYREKWGLDREHYLLKKQRDRDVALEKSIRAEKEGTGTQLVELKREDTLKLMVESACELLQKLRDGVRTIVPEQRKDLADTVGTLKELIGMLNGIMKLGVSEEDKENGGKGARGATYNIAIVQQALEKADEARLLGSGDGEGKEGTRVIEIKEVPKEVVAPATASTSGGTNPA